MALEIVQAICNLLTFPSHDVIAAITLIPRACIESARAYCCSGNQSGLYDGEGSSWQETNYVARQQRQNEECASYSHTPYHQHSKRLQDVSPLLQIQDPSSPYKNTTCVEYFFKLRNLIFIFRCPQILFLLPIICHAFQVTPHT